MHIYNSKRLSIVVEYIPGQAPYKNESLSILDKAKYQLQKRQRSHKDFCRTEKIKASDEVIVVYTDR
jgi:hypothetical protein